jgi:hypothetical protein
MWAKWFLTTYFGDSFGVYSKYGRDRDRDHGHFHGLVGRSDSFNDFSLIIAFLC